MADKFVTRDYLLEQFEGFDRAIASQKYATASAVNNKVDKVSGKGLSTNDYDNTAKNIVDNVTTNLASKVDTSTLSSYYTKAQVDAIVAAVGGGEFIAVSTLPTTDIKTNAIYLVPKSDPDTGDIKDEYINLDGTTSGWELIGSTSLDLSGYVQKSQTAGLLKNDGTVDSTAYAKLINLASSFSTSESYSVGDYVLNSNKIYKCITSHSGAWDAQDFEEVSDAMGEISSVSSLVSSKVDKVTGKGLSTYDYDATAKNKLDNLADVKSIGSGLNLNTSTGELTASGVSITIDSQMSSSSTNPVQNKVITSALSNKADTSNLGTASSKDVATSGNASSTQVVMGNDTRLTDARNAADVSAWAKASTKPTYTASEVGAIATTAKGANNGVAELDSSGKVPSSQLPSYVDDVLEYNSQSAFPATGESGKIYIAIDTNVTYRWSGSAYVEISPSLALGETSSTAYAGNKGKANADNIASIQEVIPSSASTSNMLIDASTLEDETSSYFKHAGNIASSSLYSSLLIKQNEGNSYNISTAGTTNSNFIEGAGHVIRVGATVGIVQASLGIYKFTLLSGISDVSKTIYTSAANETYDDQLASLLIATSLENLSDTEKISTKIIDNSNGYVYSYSGNDCYGVITSNKMITLDLVHSTKLDITFSNGTVSVVNSESNTNTSTLSLIMMY